MPGSTDSAAHQRDAPVDAVGAGANFGGLTFATQAVVGALGFARNDANTFCAQGDETVTAWPIPGNRRTVELGSFRAALRAQLVGSTESKPPESSRVGILSPPAVQQAPS